MKGLKQGAATVYKGADVVGPQERPHCLKYHGNASNKAILNVWSRSKCIKNHSFRFDTYKGQVT